MSLLNYLLKKHENTLTAAQKSLVAEQDRRNESLSQFAMPADMSQYEATGAFITFEREFCEQPVHLFGQDVPSLAHTIVRVFRARSGRESHIMEPATEIFSARISEKALTECMLSTNRGDAGAPLTVMSLGDFSVPPVAKDKSSVAKAVESRQAERERIARARMDALRSKLGPNVTKPSGALREAVDGLSLNVRDLKSGSFEVERYFENMSQVRNQILTEAAHAALHADKVASAMKSTTALLPPPEPIDWDKAAAEHPMVHHMLDQLPDDLREAIRLMVVAEMKELAIHHPNILNRIEEKDGVEYITFGTGRGISDMLSFEVDRKNDRALVEQLASLWNRLMNPHIAKDRPKYAAHQAALRLTERKGSTHHIHSSLPPMEQSYIAMTFTAAYIDNDFGDNQIRSRHMPIMELEIVSQDLMTALRGHPLGRPVPCTLCQVAGVSLPMVDRPLPPISAEIADVDINIQRTAEAARVEETFKKVEELVNGKRSGKAWRQEFDEALLALEEALQALSARSQDEMDEGRRQVNMHTEELARDMLWGISDCLPPATLKVLGLPGVD